MPISQTCQQNITQSEGETIEFLTDHILVRECLRVVGRPSTRMDYMADRVLAYLKSGGDSEDKARLEKDYTKAVKDDLGQHESYCSRFHNELGTWYFANDKSTSPGFDHGLCRFIWKDYACFCNGAAHAYAAGQLDGYLKQFETTTNPNISSKGKLDVKPTACDPAVMSDPFYSKVTGSTSRKAPPWWVWAGVLGVIGAVVISVDKKR